jgi:hypothetical protein
VVLQACNKRQAFADRRPVIAPGDEALFGTVAIEVTVPVVIRPWWLMMAPNMRPGNGNEGRGVVDLSKTITQEPATRVRSLIASDNSRTVGPRFGHRETTERPSESAILLRRELTHMLHGSAPGHLQHHHLSSDTPERSPRSARTSGKKICIGQASFAPTHPKVGNEQVGRDE